jgi:cytoskeletal protein CcmA (bactofilin family)
MASSYVNNLRLDEMATGDGSGTWGTTTNTNLTLIGEAFGYATVAIANASTDTLTIPNGTETDSEPRRMYLKLTGGGQACTVTLAPNTSSKVWIIENVTSYTLTFTQGSGANVAILAGETKMIATDGAGSGAVVYDVLTDVNLAGTTKVDDLTVGDDLVVNGDIDLEGAIDVNGTANLDVVDIDGAVDMASTLTLAGNADFNGDLDVDGTTNLDAVDIDGAVQADATITVGVDDTGYDVKFFGATASAYMLWDESADDLILAGAARVVVPDSGLVLGSTAVTATGTELNYVDGVTSAIQTQMDTKTSTGKAIAMALVFG